MARKFTQAQVRAAYRSVFSGRDADIVLEDLFKFCNVGRSSVLLGDSHGTAENEGKRRVALRIVGYIGMGDRELATIATRARTEDPEDDT